MKISYSGGALRVAAGLLALGGAQACAMRSSSGDEEVTVSEGARGGRGNGRWVLDASATDGSVFDAGRVDTGTPDGGTLDAGAPDGGPVDSGLVDAGGPDTGAPDTGSIAPPGECITAGSTWYNEAFAQQAGSLEAEFDARPLTSPMDGVIGLSAVSSTAYSGFAVLVRFNSAGNIDARNAGSYEALSAVRYVAGSNYHFRVAANTSTHTYSVYLLPENAAQELTLATNYAFRTEQAGVASLANWGTTADPGSLSVCNFTVTAGPPEPPPVPDTQAPTAPANVRATAVASYQVNVTWTASSDNVGVTGYRVYRDGQLAGMSSLTSFSDFGRTAAQTYCYDVLAFDAAGNESPRSTPSVCAQTPAETPTGGTCDYVINAGESINKYSSVAQPGQTICVRAGTYTETLRPQVSGTAGNLISFKAFPGDECKGNSGAKDRQLKTDCRVVIENGGVSLSRSYIRVEGFEIKSNSVGGDAVSVSAAGAQIANNFIHNVEGVYTDQIAVAVNAGAPDILVENNEIREIYRGVKINSPYTQRGVIVRNNQITKTWCDGFRGGATDIIIEGNWIHDRHSTGCHRDALDIHTLTNAIIRNNLIYNFGQYIYIAPDGLPDRVENVQIYGNILYLSDYPGDPCGEAPGIFIAYDRADDSSPAENIDIHSNTCGWLGYPCIRIHGGPSQNYRNFTIRNNILFQSGMDITGVYDITSDYNLFYTDPNAPRSRPTCSDWSKSPANDEAVPYVNEGPNSIIGINPGFRSYDYWNNFDFRLLPDSPAIDTGDRLLESFPYLPEAFFDLDGTRRPLDVPGVGRDGAGAYDFGAYEYNP